MANDIFDFSQFRNPATETAKAASNADAVQELYDLGVYSKSPNSGPSVVDLNSAFDNSAGQPPSAIPSSKQAPKRNTPSSAKPSTTPTPAAEPEGTFITGTPSQLMTQGAELVRRINSRMAPTMKSLEESYPELVDDVKNLIHSGGAAVARATFSQAVEDANQSFLAGDIRPLLGVWERLTGSPVKAMRLAGGKYRFVTTEGGKEVSQDMTESQISQTGMALADKSFLPKLYQKSMEQRGSAAAKMQEMQVKHLYAMQLEDFKANKTSENQQTLELVKAELKHLGDKATVKVTTGADGSTIFVVNNQHVIMTDSNGNMRTDAAKDLNKVIGRMQSDRPAPTPKPGPTGFMSYRGQ